MTLGLPRPGKGLMWVMGVLLFVWVSFAVAINFVGLSREAFFLFAGNTQAILRGEVWRLLTAGFLHQSWGNGSVQQILFALMGLYFLAPSLEERWGVRRMVAFLIGSSIFGFTAQFAAEWLLPDRLAGAIGQAYWFGSFGAIEAVAVAWALSNRGQSVRLFFVLPVSSTGLLLFIVGVSVLRIIGDDKPLEGAVTPFGGMLAGYLFGAGTPTPARRVLLKLRYSWLQRRAARYRGSRPRLTVIEGKRKGPDGGPTRGRKPPTDKRFLN
jgi:membrane associated rhomboid family serine protease